MIFLYILPFWQKNGQYRTDVPSELSKLSPRAFRLDIGPPDRYIVLTRHRLLGPAVGIVPRYKELYFHSL